MNISNDTGTAVAELAELQYSAITAGIKTADSVGFVETAVKAATVFSTDTGTIINGLTNVMNAYKLEASEAGKIAGQMLIVNNLGHSSFEELDKSMTKLLPTASRLNIGTDELFASLAALTTGSNKTSDAIKEVEKIIEIIENPADSVRKTARGLGLDFSETALRTKGLVGFLEEIKQKTNGNSTALRKLFSDQKAFNAVNLLTVSGANSFTESLSAMQNATEKLDSAFAIIDASPAERWGDIINIIRNAGIRLGTALLPVIEKITEKVEIFADMFANMDFGPLVRQIEILADRLMNSLDFEKIVNSIKNFFESVFKAVGTISKMVGVLWDLRGVILSLVVAWGIFKTAVTAAVVVSKIANFTKSVKTLMAAQKGMNAVQAIFNVLLTMNPIGVFVVAIGVLIGVLVLLYNKCEPFRDFVNSIFEKLKEFGTHIKQIFTPAFEVLKGVWGKIISTLGEMGRYIGRVFGLFSGLFSGISGGTEKFSLLDIILKTVSTSFQVVGSLIGGIVDTIGALFSGINNIMDAFKNGGFLEGIKQIGISILNFILTPIKGILDALSYIPGVGKLATAGLEKLNGFTNILNDETEKNTAVRKVQNVVPAQVRTIPAIAATQTATATAAIPAAIPAYGRRTNITGTAGVSTATPVPPMTRAEQYTYSQTTNRDEVEIGVRAESGTSVRAIRRPRSPNVTLNASGGNRG
jgi:TP901 family phage tail tape measure protein